MKDGQVRVVTAGTESRRRRIIYLLPLFLAAVAIGFLLELSTYESLNLSDIRLAFVHLPQKFNQIKEWKSPREPAEFLKPILEDLSESLEEQAENETVILESNNPTTVIVTEEKVLEFWEEPNLLNVANFSWARNNDSICKVGPDDPKDVRIMPVLVHTARSHFQERLALRKSWGSLPIYKNWDIRFVFLLGDADRGSNPKINEKEYKEQELALDMEQQQFGDIVQGTFLDSYKNLTYKHLMGYKWVLNFCRNAEFVLKIDDDMFIDIMRWLDWRTEELEKYNKDNSFKIPELFCHTFGGTKPIREKASKWYAPPEEWPDEYYPDYCSGWAYAITVDLVQKIYSVSNMINFFWVDDVFVTGALLEVVKQTYDYKPEIRHIWGEVTGDIKDWRDICSSETFDYKRGFKAVVYVPRGEFFERDMMCMWNKTLHDSKYVFT